MTNLNTQKREIKKALQQGVQEGTEYLVPDGCKTVFGKLHNEITAYAFGIINAECIYTSLLFDEEFEYTELGKELYEYTYNYVEQELKEYLKNLGN